MTRLGSYGRFGNQLLQYAFVRLHAKEHNLIAEFPDWIGRDLFDLDDPVPSASLSQADEKEFDVSDALSGARPNSCRARRHRFLLRQHGGRGVVARPSSERFTRRE